MKKKTLAAAVLAALALGGCSAGNHSAEPGPSTTASLSPTAAAEIANGPANGTATSETAEAAEGTNPRQAWADEKINQYLNGNGAHSFRAFPGSVQGDTISWSSPDEGELAIVVENGWSAADLDSYANLVLLSVGHESPELIKATVKTADGTVSVSGTDKSPWE